MELYDNSMQSLQEHDHVDVDVEDALYDGPQNVVDALDTPVHAYGQIPTLSCSSCGADELPTYYEYDYDESFPEEDGQSQFVSLNTCVRNLNTSRDKDIEENGVNKVRE